MLTTDPLHAQLALFADPHEIAPDVLMHASFVNTYALRTPDGLLLVDPGFEPAAPAVHRAVRAWSEAPLHTAVYTHGHVDHAFGLQPFLDAGERPQIIAQENCVRALSSLSADARLERAHQSAPVQPAAAAVPGPLSSGRR